MKRFNLLLIAVFTVLAFGTRAQLKVDNLGKVGILTGTSSISSQLQVGDITNYNSSTISIGSDFRIGSYNSGAPYSFVSARDNSTRSIGMVLRVQSSGSITNALTILPNGNIGIGSSYSPTYNLDVLGTINASTSVRAAGIVLTSDERLKENITKLSGLSVASLMNLQGVSYRLKPNGASILATGLSQTNDIQSDSVKNQTIGQAENTTFYSRNHVGFIAQDLQKVFPELVYSDKDGILSIDYIGLIPILVESIKELENKHKKDSLSFVSLQNKLTDLEILFIQCCEKSALKQSENNSGSIESTYTLPILYQNTPNPFNQNTTINYYLPENIKTACLYVYNMQGAQIKVFPIVARASGNIIINGNELSPGMYLYSLIADGMEVDTKRMILTN